MLRNRHHSLPVKVAGVTIGGQAPIVVQSMTNTDTADVESTARQVQQLAAAGSELVRITVNTAEAAAAVPHIGERLQQLRCSVPLIGDFHFNGHKLLQEHPACAEVLAKYRINPGNVGRGSKRDPQFAEMIEIACRNGKPVRIGVNWGSLDQDLLLRLMDENSRRSEPHSAQEVMRDAIVRSALDSAERAGALGLPRDGLEASHRDPINSIRLLHYPPQPAPGFELLGARPHTDTGIFTILLQDEHLGLEVADEAGEWLVVPPIPGTFVINIAEVMTALTNGRYASARHRVVTAYGAARYSVPFFVNPDYDAMVAPLPQFVDHDHPAAYQPYRAGDALHTLFRNLWPGAGQVDSAA